MDHCMGGGATGLIPGNEDKITLGHRPNGIYVPRFRNVKEKHPGFVRLLSRPLARIQALARLSKAATGETERQG